jgi:hypothetical protein
MMPSAMPILHAANRANTDWQPKSPAVPPFELGPSVEHPLKPVLNWAIGQLPAIENLKDYSATLVKRERVNGVVGGYEYLSLKVRHKPFSVYARFLAPAAIKGQEVIYIRGQNHGNLWAHRRRGLGTLSIMPNSPIAMKGERYPITDAGLLNLVRRLVEVAQEDVKHGECEVRYFPGAKVNQRLCTCVQVIHPVPRRNFRFYLARIFVDDELKLPIRYEAYEWPATPGADSELIEEYTYLDLKLNNGFTDADFSTMNPNYRFR